MDGMHKLCYIYRMQSSRIKKPKGMGINYYDRSDIEKLSQGFCNIVH